LRKTPARFRTERKEARPQSWGREGPRTAGQTFRSFRLSGPTLLAAGSTPRAPSRCPSRGRHQWLGALPGDAYFPPPAPRPAGPQLGAGLPPRRSGRSARSRGDRLEGDAGVAPGVGVFRSSRVSDSPRGLRLRLKFRDPIRLTSCDFGIGDCGPLAHRALRVSNLPRRPVPEPKRQTAKRTPHPSWNCSGLCVRSGCGSRLIARTYQGIPTSSFPGRSLSSSATATFGTGDTGSVFG